MHTSTGLRIPYGVFGILSLLTGGILVFVGSNTRNRLYEQGRMWGYMKSSAPGMIAAGWILFIIGVALLLIRFYFSFMEGRRFYATLHNSDDDTVDDVFALVASTHSIYGIFHSEDKKRAISFYHDDTCILKEGSRIYRGTMESPEEQTNQPDLWQITLDCDDRQERYDIRLIDRNILIRSEQGEEIFYRS